MGWKRRHEPCPPLWGALGAEGTEVGGLVTQSRAGTPGNSYKKAALRTFQHSSMGRVSASSPAGTAGVAPALANNYGKGIPAQESLNCLLQSTNFRTLRLGKSKSCGLTSLWMLEASLQPPMTAKSYLEPSLRGPVTSGPPSILIHLTNTGLSLP